MSTASATWMEKCPVCKGTGKLQTLDKDKKVLNPSEDCMVCDGRGYIMVKKSFLRKKV